MANKGKSDVRQCAPAKRRTKMGVSDRAGVLGWGQRKGVVGPEKSGLWMRAVHARARTVPSRRAKSRMRLKRDKGSAKCKRVRATRRTYHTVYIAMLWQLRRRCGARQRGIVRRTLLRAHAAHRIHNLANYSLPRAGAATISLHYLGWLLQ